MSFPNIKNIVDQLSHIQYFTNIFNFVLMNLIIQCFIYLNDMVIYKSRCKKS